MKKTVFTASLISLMSLALFNPAAHANDEDVKNALESFRLTNVEIKEAPMPGYKAIFASEGIFFISNDGHYFIEGNVYDLKNKPAQNALAPLLRKKVDALVKTDAITYKAPKEAYAITIFTDITCTYCKKLHEEIKTYADEGITVNYLSFPRAGMDSGSAKDMQSIWCNADKKKALNAAFKSEKVPEATCGEQKFDVEKHFVLGRQLGLQGTPGIVLPDGQLVPGYIPAKDLKTELDKRHNKS